MTLDGEPVPMYARVRARRGSVLEMPPVGRGAVITSYSIHYTKLYEISKQITDAMSDGPIVTGDFAADMAMVRSVIEYPYGTRFKDPGENHGSASRSIRNNFV